jgi:hypothetical protein
VLLILLGIGFLVVQFLPGWTGWFSWPMLIVGVGVFLLLLGIFNREPGMAIPACIVGGIGGLMYWQNATGNWDSWSYAWTLIPGFAGIGTILSGILSGDGSQVRGGLWPLVISLILFAAFGSFFGAMGFLGRYWPVLLIALGVLLLFESVFRRRS